MRLSTIKMAGFKSFVDSTTINLPSNLGAIVGPNGCGKSNTIDAVRWVMGESSAKHLRGASMDDVIFSGSASRKPVGMASVELVFDNSDRTLEGEFAGYNEISVKRTLTRDGTSKYYLNGTRCRRRDVADLFLGTGLGPRSYAIIEQGMISRLIDAKPEELRVFLEEAAGISKYKERRRETETRIRHTRENLDRLNDLREEIEKQLSHLQRQSRTAERYKEFKVQERQLKSELLYLRWVDLQREVDQRELTIKEYETSLEAVIADLRSTESTIEEQRAHQVEANDSLNEVQGRYYGLGADISRREQSIQHQKEMHQRQVQELQSLEQSLNEAESSLLQDQEQLELARAQLQESEPELEMRREQQEVDNAVMHEAEESMNTLQNDWEDYNRRSAEPAQVAQVERNRMEQLERHIQQMQTRLQRIEDQKKNLNSSESEVKLASQRTELTAVAAIKEEMSVKRESVMEDLSRVRETNATLQQQQDIARHELNDTQAKLVSLQALQKAALGKQDANVVAWLEGQQLSENSRLVEHLRVDEGWDTAVETVLGQYLQAVCVDTLDSVNQVLGSFDSGQISFIESSASSSATAPAEWLAAKVQSDLDLSHLLNNVRVADDLNSAMSLRGQLSEGQSIITKDGVWLGHNWLRLAKDNDAKSGIVAREKEIESLKEQLEMQQQRLHTVEEQVASGREQLQQTEQQREHLQAEQNQIHQQHAELQAQINARETRLEQVKKSEESLLKEETEIRQQVEDENQSIEAARLKRNQAMTQIDELSREHEALSKRREQTQSVLQQGREKARSSREAAHELAIKIEGLRTSSRNLEQNIERMKVQLEQQQTRRSEIQAAIVQGNNPIKGLEQELAELLEKRLLVENELNEARSRLGKIENELRALEQKRHEHEQKSQTVRNTLEQSKMNAQEIRVRSLTVKEQMEESDVNVDEIKAALETLQDAPRIPDWQRKADEVMQRIQRLGPINLAAIDEYQEQLKRKEYLDAQNDDVTSALTTLEEAIAKIDKETRHRFKETFDHVNSRIQEMFPRLFGGGQAYLEMTGEDLLDTGVTVMARPPGKRISHIQLMSGGEKALTAVALVFAIFELNPAPFCMLDEVDAPLDEANVGRFCELVKHMSDTVQFIFITHNKSTMEMAEHLSGVTMRESGVSRLVSVDVDAAAQLAEVE
ncbi:MAG: chromosome segregation protein SMC [Gammaproteobacteria bacterium]|nr:chromosome segregation protein SMC [Gammaproteobacteria bacterium]